METLKSAKPRPPRRAAFAGRPWAERTFRPRSANGPARGHAPRAGAPPPPFGPEDALRNLQEALEERNRRQALEAAAAHDARVAALLAELEAPMPAPA
jgi:hypothetical protein